MKSNKKILRRDFIIYFFFAFMMAFIIKDNFIKEALNIDSEINKKIKNYNSLRIINTEKDLRLAIESDHKNNKTIWVGKKLYTFAEVN